MYTAADVFKKAGTRSGTAGGPKAYPRPLGMRSGPDKPRRAETAPIPDMPAQAAFQARREPIYARQAEPDARINASRPDRAPQTMPFGEQMDRRRAEREPQAPPYANAREDVRRPDRSPPVLSAQMNPTYVPPPTRNPEIYKGLMARHDRVSQRHIQK